MSARDDVVSFAQKQLGKPYVWGATGPDGYDCSGLVYAAYKAAGLNVQREVASQLGTEGEAVTEATAQPGDVVYYNEPGSTDHVGIYIGGGRMIDAPTTGKNVEVDDIHSFGQVTSIRALPQLKGSVWSNLAGGVSQAAGQAGDALGSVGSALNPFSGWQTSALDIGLKVAAVAACGALLIVGAKQTVNSGE